MTVRIVANGRPVSRADLVDMVEAHREHVEATARRFRNAGPAPGKACRVMVTRSGLGNPNSRFSVKRGEGPAGRVNPTSDAHCAGEVPTGGYITATRRDSFGHEAGTHVEHRHTHRKFGETIDCPVSA